MSNETDVTYHRINISGASDRDWKHQFDGNVASSTELKAAINLLLESRDQNVERVARALWFREGHRCRFCEGLTGGDLSHVCETDGWAGRPSLLPIRAGGGGPLHIKPPMTFENLLRQGALRDVTKELGRSDLTVHMSVTLCNPSDLTLFRYAFVQRGGDVERHRIEHNPTSSWMYELTAIVASGA